jgi:hypothetical protein
MSTEIPIAEPMRTKRQCQRCGGWERCVYVKTEAGFRRVCVPCAHEWRDAGVLKMPDRVWPMKTKEVF